MPGDDSRRIEIKERMPGESNKLRDKSYSLAIEKEMRKTLRQFSSQKKLDTKEDPQNNHGVEDQGQLWDFDAN